MSESLQRYEDNKPEAVEDRAWVAPLVDVYENENELLLIADLPGVTQDSLKIDLDNETLTLVGRIHEEVSGHVLGREFQSVDYRRSFMLPGGIDASKISAELSNGVLNLHLPKSEEIKPRRIEVKIA